MLAFSSNTYAVYALRLQPLRLIIMLATLRVSDFTSNTTLFRTPPPVISIVARQQPVTIHFNRRTAADYVTEAVRKAVKIHTRLPPGGILVFLTGQNEIVGVCKKLEARFGRAAIKTKKAQRRNRASVLYPGRGRDEEKQDDSMASMIPTQGRFCLIILRNFDLQNNSRFRSRGHGPW